ncbi:hypothetical protein ACWEQC_12740 [Streptomyces shenzhenensis]
MEEIYHLWLAAVPSPIPADAIELPRLESFLHQHLGLHLLPQEPGREIYEQMRH